ncbi:hypothetical protein FACS189440_12950 [Bacteroidia bacterium]|nr:hypothetical protein FACS189440_12950 [Bacteroidia bacterium]
MPQLAQTTIARHSSKALRNVPPLLPIQKKNPLPPLGYMTHTEFVKQCNTEIDSICKKYGIL